MGIIYTCISFARQFTVPLAIFYSLSPSYASILSFVSRFPLTIIANLAKNYTFPFRYCSSVRGLILRIRKREIGETYLPCKSILCRFHSHQPHFPYLISLILLSIALASLDTLASASSALVRLSSFAFICSSTSLILRSINLRNIGSFSASFFISSKDSF